MNSINKITSVVICSCFFVIGIIFKFLHWPGSSILFLICSAVLTAFSIGGILILKEKNIFSLTIATLGTIWFTILLWGNLFNNGHPFNWLRFRIYGVAFLICIVSYVLIKIKRRKKNRNET